MSRFLPILFVLIAIALFFFYIRPEWTGAITQSKSELTGYNAALDAASRFSAQEAKLEAERDQIPADNLDRLSTFLPDGVNNVQLIVDLSALAARSGLTLSNFSTPSTPTAPTDTTGSGDTSSGFGAGQSNPVDSLTITMSATGSYAAFRTFLAGIEQSLRPLDLTSVSIAPGSSNTYAYQMTLTFYWLH